MQRLRPHRLGRRRSCRFYQRVRVPTQMLHPKVRLNKGCSVSHLAFKGEKRQTGQRAWSWAMATQGKFVCTLPFVHRISQDEFQSKVHEQQEAQWFRLKHTYVLEGPSQSPDLNLWKYLKIADWDQVILQMSRFLDASVTFKFAAIKGQNEIKCNFA